MEISNEERLKGQLTEAVIAFQRDQMSVTAESVWVDLHPGALVVTVRGAISPAEQSCARDGKGRELLDRFYSRLFEVSKRTLEEAVEAILGLPMRQSRLCVDTESGAQVILFTFCGNPQESPLQRASAQGIEDAQAKQESCESILQAHMDWENYWKLKWLENPALHRFAAEVIELCNPSAVFVCTDSPEDINWVRQQAITGGEETRLRMEGHTYHFDGPQDQGADREVTKYLVPAAYPLPKDLNQIEREEGLAEIRGLLKGSMAGRTMIMRFLCLGLRDSVFSIPYVQCTDSFYVAHSEDLLYRTGYEQFRKLRDAGDFLRAVHSAGRLDSHMVSIDVDKKRIYVDYTCDTIYSVNTQYAGNTVGLEKLAQGMAIRKADREGWLAEHMSIISMLGPDGRKSYIAGTFPGGSGSAPAGMQSGDTIVGNGTAYVRATGGKARAVGAEAGIFGIIRNVNPTDNPATYKALTAPGEVIFSNVLIKDGKPYWPGMGSEMPKEGVNATGLWHVGKTDRDGNAVPLANRNARYTVSLRGLGNVDPEADNPLGVEVRGIIYGGRDALASVPVQQSFDWKHGIITYGAALETETALPVIGKEGVPELNLMNIRDFLSIPLGKYMGNTLDFIGGIREPLPIFGINYFERNEPGQLVNTARDSAVWLKWIELRIHGEAEAIATPTGYIPGCEDLVLLFREVLGKDYLPEHYVEQFTTRIVENIAKIDRVDEFCRANVPDAPQMLFDVLHVQRERLERARRQFGDYISPLDIANAGFEKG